MDVSEKPIDYSKLQMIAGGMLLLHILLIALFDVGIMLLFGRQASISWAIRGWVHAYPALGVMIGIALGALFVHLFLSD